MTLQEGWERALAGIDRQPNTLEGFGRALAYLHVAYRILQAKWN